MVAHTTPGDTILDPYHSSSTGTLSSHPILNIQDADYFSALSRNPGSTLATSPGRGASHPILNIQDADYFSALSVNPGSTLATSAGRGSSSFPTASFSGDPSLHSNRSTGTFSGIPIFNEQGSDYFSARVQSRNPATTSPAGGCADFIPMSSEPYLFGSPPPGTFSGLPILNEQRPVDFPALIQSVVTSPGRADFTPGASLVGDLSLSGNLSSRTLSGLPVLNEPELDHLSAPIQSRNRAYHVARTCGLYSHVSSKN
ncbi:hypothetical protein B0H14DRAFT_3482094 [Mycena olivaceomarginata]|nr:hypothetical protein B0H14DRAFT_3482094 [Mycena olivaceomarginata]